MTDHSQDRRDAKTGRSLSLLSVHIADLLGREALGALCAQRHFRQQPGAVFAMAMSAVPLRTTARPSLPNPRRVGLVIGWRDAASYARFVSEDSLTNRLRSGFSVLLEPLRVWGAWPDAGPIPTVADDRGSGPVAALTLGRLRIGRTLPFLSASAAAEQAAAAHPGLLAGTAFTRPPWTVATFTLWRDVAAVRDYAATGSSTGHRDAIAAHRARSFHHEAVFIRLRPLESTGLWDGRDPLA